MSFSAFSELQFGWGIVDFQNKKNDKLIEPEFFFQVYQDAHVRLNEWKDLTGQNGPSYISQVFCKVYKVAFHPPNVGGIGRHVLNGTYDTFDAADNVAKRLNRMMHWGNNPAVEARQEPEGPLKTVTREELVKDGATLPTGDAA